jgi:hypothetical protein
MQGYPRFTLSPATHWWLATQWEQAHEGEDAGDMEPAEAAWGALLGADAHTLPWIGTDAPGPSEAPGVVLTVYLGEVALEFLDYALAALVEVDAYELDVTPGMAALIASEIVGARHTLGTV